jgi:predicted nuclease of predicted toxin-antitoxin system
MLKKIKFHLDENAPKAIAEGLRRRGIDVTTTAEVDLIAASDEEQLMFVYLHKRVIFTQDRDFLKLHDEGKKHCGIVYCIKGSRSIGEILRGLILIWEVLEPDELRGKVEFL